MCMIVYKPPGQALPSDSRLGYIWYHNSDGSGFVFPRDGELIIRKGHESFDSFYSSLMRDFDAEKPYILHFRIRTSGDRSQRTCHPFLINDNLAIAHNGVLSGFQGLVNASISSKDSDTLQLVKLLRGLPDNWIYNRYQRAILEEAAKPSKLAVMASNGDVYLFNEKGGTWNENCWYSHTGFGQSTHSGYGYGPDGRLVKVAQASLKDVVSRKVKPAKTSKRNYKKEAKESAKAFLDDGKPAENFLCGDCLYEDDINEVTPLGECPKCKSQRLIVCYEHVEVN